jgi:large subunit ribosomal protein L5
MRLKEQYKKEVVPEMMKKFNYKSPMAVPRLEKIVVNSGFGREVTGKSSSEREKVIKTITEVLSLITGQKPSLRKARKSISSFKLRKGQPVGAKVTLRGQRMYDFLERLIKIVLPRTRDFKGIPSKSVDEEGNLTLGFKEYSPFPEVTIEKEKGVFGLEVTLVTTAKTKEEGIALLKLMGVPLKEEK